MKRIMGWLGSQERGYRSASGEGISLFRIDIKKCPNQKKVHTSLVRYESRDL